jgi:hypothetical protein
MSKAQGNIPGPYFDRVTIQGMALTSRLINAASGGAQLRTAAIAQRVARRWHHFNANGNTVKIEDVRPTRFDGVPDNVREYLQQNSIEGWAITGTFSTGEQPLTKVAPVTITNATGSITLACGTSGAAIYYTTDGTFPYFGNANATLYGTPFATPATGTLIRAAAYKTGSVGSNVAELEVP